MEKHRKTKLFVRLYMVIAMLLLGKVSRKVGKVSRKVVQKLYFCTRKSQFLCFSSEILMQKRSIHAFGFSRMSFFVGVFQNYICMFFLLLDYKYYDCAGFLDKNIIFAV